MSFKRIIFWSHLVVGLATGVVIFILALTGVFLTYEMQIEGFFAPKVSPTVERAEMLSTDELIAIAQPVFKGQTATLDYYSDASKPLTVKAGRHDVRLIDPYSGSFIESGSNPTDGFFQFVEDLHRSLAMGFNSTGAQAVKVSNLAFLFIAVSGIYLWLPRRWKWPFIKQKIVFIRKAPTSKARDYNWHHVFSFWVLIPLIAVVGSGVVLSYQWANTLVFQAAGLSVQQGRGMGKGMGKGMWARSTEAPDSALATDQLVTYQKIFEKARDVEAGWQVISFVLPNSEKAKTIDIVIDTGNGKQATAQQTVTYSRETGNVVKIKGPDEMATPTQSLRRYIRFLHTGEVYGVIGQTLAGIASLATLFMVWTGFALAWRRLIGPWFKPHAKVIDSTN
ncbi:PepSY-associated TM helix domain-containing protein [Cohaesibacter celericrescens]|uniref:PepSY-associated TM helix domain-containing protein n=1 Tax=Cohaesibacter celericrescens TaxID=2067669 RepID=UPI00356357C1